MICSISLGCAQEPYNTYAQYLPGPLDAAGRQRVTTCSEYRENGTVNGARRRYWWNAHAGDEGSRRQDVCGRLDMSPDTDWSITDTFDGDEGGWLLRAALTADNAPAWRLQASCVSRAATFTDLHEQTAFSDDLTSGRSLSVSVLGPLTAETASAGLRFRVPVERDETPTEDPELHTPPQADEAPAADPELHAPPQPWEGEWTAERGKGDAADRAVLVVSEQSGAEQLAVLLGAAASVLPLAMEVTVQPDGDTIIFNLDESSAVAAVASECNPIAAAA